MINFVLKYTGTYGLLAILAVAIVTPTYIFFTGQQETLSQRSEEKQVVNKENFSKEEVSTKKAEETLNESVKKSEKKETTKQDKNSSTEKAEETLNESVEKSEKKETTKQDKNSSAEKAEETANESVKKSEKKETTKQENKSTREEVESLSIDVFRVDEFGNIISAGKVSKKAKIEMIADKKIIGTDNTSEDGSFVVFGKVQSTGLVQTVKIRGFIEDNGLEKIVDSADLFFVLPKVESNNKKEENKIDKKPLIVRDDGDDLKILRPIQVSSVESITLDTISYNENSSTELAGRARLNNSVRIYINNDLKSEVKVNDSGAWRVSLSDIKAGVYTLRLDEVNENGTVEGRLELPFKREEEALIQAMGEGSITVQPGNSLWRIARKYYGKGIQYVEIFERNSHLIRDPDLIYPGQVFSLPN